MPRAAGTSLTDPLLPGMIIMTGSTATPAGWLYCDGSAVSRTTYKALFGAIGTNFGTGDGSTTFNLPDFEGASATTQRAPTGVYTGALTPGTTTASALSNAATVQGGVLTVRFLIKF